MADIKWIKLSVGFATDSKIRYIRGCKNGDQMALLWVLLLCRAGAVNDAGQVYVAPDVPYTSATLAAEFGMQPRVVEDALQLFAKLGMISVTCEIIKINKWSEHQNIDGLERARETSRETSRRYREKQRAGRNCYCHDDVTVTDNDVTVTEQNKKEEKEEEGEYQKNRDIDNAYQTGTRARAKTAQIIVDDILAEHYFAERPAELHDAVYHALGHGWTPDGIINLAKCGDWAVFASQIMTAGQENLGQLDEEWRQ